MATDPDGIFLQLGLDATRFGDGANQLKKYLKEIGATVVGESAKWEFARRAGGQTIATWQAMTAEGSKIIATLAKVGNHFEVTGLKIRESLQGITDEMRAEIAAREDYARSVQKQLSDREKFEEAAFAKLRARFAEEAALRDQSIRQQLIQRAIAEQAAANTFHAGEDAHNALLQDQIQTRIEFENQVNTKLQTRFENDAREKEAILRDSLLRQQQLRIEFENQTAEKLKAQFASEAQEREADLIASIQKQQLLRIEFENKAAKALQDQFRDRAADEARVKADAVRKEQQEREAFEDSAAKKLQTQFGKEAADKRKQIQDRAAFENQAQSNLRKEFEKTAQSEVQTREQSIQQQIRERIEAENRIASQLQQTFRQEAQAETQARRDSIQQQIRERIEFENQTAARLRQQIANGGIPGPPRPPGFGSAFGNAFFGNRFGQGASVFAGTFAGGLAANALTSTVNALREGFHESIEFERALARLQVVQRGTSLSTEQLGARVLELSNKYNIARNDVVEAATQIFQSGLTKSDEGAQKLLDTGAQLAKVTGSTLDDSVTTLTTALNAFNLTAEDAERVSKLLFATYKDGGPSLRETATVLGHIGSLVEPFGIKIEEVSAALAVFNKRGLNANESLTLLTNIFAKLANPGTNKGLLEFFESKGVSNLDQLVALRGLGGILEDIGAKAQAGASDIAELFGQQKSGKGAVVFTNIVKDFNAELERGAEGAAKFSEAVKSIQTNAGEKTSNAVNALKNALLDFGSALLKSAGFQKLAETLQIAADAANKRARDQADQNALVDEEVKKYEKLAAIIKQVRQLGRVAPGTDVNGLPTIAVPKQQSVSIFGTDEDLKNAIKANDFRNRLRSAGLNPDDLEITDVIKKAIDAEQARQKANNETAKVHQSNEEANAKATKKFFDEQTKAALQAFSERYKAHTDLIKAQQVKENELSKQINNSIDVQIRRADEGVRKLEDVAKRAHEVRKQSLEFVQEKADSETERTFQRNLKLEQNPFSKQDLTKLHELSLKSQAEELLRSFVNKTGDDFLGSKNIELAKQKLSQLEEVKQKALDDEIDLYNQGKASQNDVFEKQADLNRLLAEEYDLQKKLQDALDEKEKKTKAQADAQKTIVENLKSSVSEVFNFNPFVEKNKPIGQRGVAGSVDEQLANFDKIANNIKKQQGSLSLDQVINISSQIAQKREQLVRELNAETSEKGINERRESLENLAQHAVANSSSVVALPEFASFINGIKQLGDSLDGKSAKSVPSALANFGVKVTDAASALDLLTRIANSNANEKAYLDQLEKGLNGKIYPTSGRSGDIRTDLDVLRAQGRLGDFSVPQGQGRGNYTPHETNTANIVINVSSSDPKTAGQSVWNEIKQQARRGKVNVKLLGEQQ